MNEATRATLMSSAQHDWRTPPELFGPLDAEFGFDLDAAADDGNHLCPAYFTEYNNSLVTRWRGRVWCNPPYGRQIGRWTDHARYAVERGHAELVVMLLPSRTDTRWWHADVMQADMVRLIRGRVHFLGSDGEPIRDQHGRSVGAPFPSALVIWRLRSERSGDRPRVEAYEVGTVRPIRIAQPCDLGVS